MYRYDNCRSRCQWIYARSGIYDLDDDIITIYVHHFQSLGEFILTNPNMTCKPRGKVYSINEGYGKLWSPGIAEYIRTRKDPPVLFILFSIVTGSYFQDGKPAYGQRYVGSMVADVHRTLLNGGIFLYPATSEAPNGKVCT